MVRVGVVLSALAVAGWSIVIGLNLRDGTEDDLLVGLVFVIYGGLMVWTLVLIWAGLVTVALILRMLRFVKPPSRRNLGSGVSQTPRLCP